MIRHILKFPRSRNNRLSGRHALSSMYPSFLVVQGGFRIPLRQIAVRLRNIKLP